jgi:hypothetical protein
MAVYKLKFHPGFINELENAILYYDEQVPYLGKKLESQRKNS